MADLIDRQAAIDSVEKESQIDGAYGYMDTKSIVDLLNDLPSAHTDVPDRNVGDMISRQDVLALAKDVILINGAKHRCIDATQIHELPSAQRKGKWIDVNGDGSLYECDQCHDLSCCVGNYCMECGARMEETNED